SSRGSSCKARAAAGACRPREKERSDVKRIIVRRHSSSPRSMVRAKASDMPASTLPEQVSFEAVFRAHAPYVWRLLRRLGLQEAAPEDAAQEVFLVVQKKRKSCRGGPPLRPWIYAIAPRVASEHRRRPYRRREQPAGDDLPERTAPASQEDHVERRRALDRLD